METLSAAFLDCVEDGGARLLMSIGKGLLLLWFFEVPVEAHAGMVANRASKPKTASINPASSAVLSKRYVSLEKSPELEAKEGLEGYYSELEDEQALGRIRSRINPEGLNEDELLQMAIQASLADASDLEEAVQRHLFI